MGISHIRLRVRLSTLTINFIFSLKVGAFRLEVQVGCSVYKAAKTI